MAGYVILFFTSVRASVGGFSLWGAHYHKTRVTKTSERQPVICSFSQTQSISGCNIVNIVFFKSLCKVMINFFILITNIWEPSVSVLLPLGSNSSDSHALLVLNVICPYKVQGKQLVMTFEWPLKLLSSEAQTSTYSEKWTQILSCPLGFVSEQL